MGGRLRKDGQPDMRYNSNRESATSNYAAQKSAVTTGTFRSSDNDRYDRNAPGPLRKDGQPDMRYAVNKKYVAERDANKNKVAENQKTPDWNAPGPLRKDGQPDMHYAVNRKYIAERDANKVAENDRYDRNAPGPLRKDGQPDMRYTVNKKYVAERDANKQAENKKTTKVINKTKVYKVKVQFGHVNAQSLLRKADKLEHLIAQSKLNVVAVTETWFENDCHLNDACPKGFKALHRPRIGRRGGGVAIFYRDNIQITRHYHKSYKSFEYLDVSIASGSSEKIRLVIIYRPTGGSKLEFLQQFKDMLEGSNKDKIIFTGDFNLHVEDPRDKYDRAFLDFIKSNGLEQHVKESTHEKGGILDLILSRPSDKLVENVLVGDYFSDHKSVECTISIEMKKEEIIEREISEREE